MGRKQDRIERNAISQMRDRDSLVTETAPKMVTSLRLASTRITKHRVLGIGSADSRQVFEDFAQDIVKEAMTVGLLRGYRRIQLDARIAPDIREFQFQLLSDDISFLKRITQVSEE